MIRTGTLGTLPNGLLARTYTLTCKDVSVTLTNYGATLLKVVTPDKNKHPDDILLGYQNIKGYLGQNVACYGATIGPVANRSEFAQIMFNDRVYHLPQNDGPHKQNNLHTDLENGLHKKLWGAKVDKDHNTVILTCSLEDMELGLPGDRTFTARFELSSLNDTHQQLRISYTCTTNMPTFVNMTNHSYFNLAGHASGSILDQRVCIHAQNYLPIREDGISEGTILPVQDTPFDFREERTIGADMPLSNEQLLRGRGYDHCYCIDNYHDNTTVRSALYASDPQSGRHLHISVSTPGAHFYTGNQLNESDAKDGATYQAHAGFAFEPEFYPNCSRHSEWPQPVCTPTKPYRSTTIYTFSTDIIETEDDIYDM